MSSTRPVLRTTLTVAAVVAAVQAIAVLAGRAVSRRVDSGAMGGLEIRVPDGWRVTAEADSPTTGLSVAEPSGEVLEDAPHLSILSHAWMSGLSVERS
jgi:hypothetical protein